MDISPNNASFSACNSVRNGHNLLNKGIVESSILADVANYHLNSLNEKLNRSRKSNGHGSIWNQNAIKADDKEFI